jgi:hypothetical protein
MMIKENEGGVGSS